MQEDSRKWRDLEEKIVTVEDAVYYQGDYLKFLMAATDHPTHDIDAVNKLFFEWKQHKIENFMTFRDHAYRSAITGRMSALQRTAWQDAHDDTLEAYL